MASCRDGIFLAGVELHFLVFPANLTDKITGMSDLIPAPNVELIKALDAPALLLQIRPAWQARDLTRCQPNNYSGLKCKTTKKAKISP